jgi:hypothetical protein
VYYKAPACKCFDEDACFSSNGNVRLPVAAFYAVELTEILCLSKEAILDVLDRFPQYIGLFIRKHHEMRWLAFTRFVRRAELTRNAASIIFNKREKLRSRISLLRTNDALRTERGYSGVVPG